MAFPTPEASLRPPIVLDAVIIGAGQAGLAAAYYLQQRGLHFRVLEAAPTVGAAWAARYDSLRLFSPAWPMHWAIRKPRQRTWNAAASRSRA